MTTSKCDNRGARELRRWRSGKRFTAKQVAEKIGAWPQTLFALERGNRIPSLIIAVALEQLAGIEPRRWLQA